MTAAARSTQRPDLSDSLTLADIAAVESPLWAQQALRAWLVSAGEAVSLAPAAAIKDTVEMASRRCNGCDAQVADWMPDGITHDGMFFHSEDCLYADDPELHRSWVKATR